MTAFGEARKDLEYIKTCIKAALDNEPAIENEQQIKAVKTRSILKVKITVR